MQGTRRDFLLGGAAMLGGMTSFGSPVKSMLGGREVSFNSGFENPYVTKGLIAMWDGEWNIGLGKHDAEATIWKDLSGNGYDLEVDQSKAWFGENFFHMLSNTTDCAHNPMALRSEIWSLGATWRATTTAGYIGGRILSTGSPKRKGIGTRQAKWINGGNAVASEFGGNDSAYYEYNFQTRAWNYDSFDTVFSALYINNAPYRHQKVSVAAVNTDVGYLSLASPVVARRFYNIRIYGRRLSEEEILHNGEVDAERFGIAI